MDKVIEVSNLSKKFKLYQGRAFSLKERILYWGQQKSEEYWVLKDINLSIAQGKTIGLVGKNGSGKSTLLKLISQILYPTEGKVAVHGKMSTLLELGAGFHPDFTGRENIYLNGSILGLSRKEISSRMDQIIDFSELHEFIDNPVRNYSSGMHMRLGFSVAIHVNPDILLIDEVLAVGDFNFQKKCMEEIFNLQRLGKTIVFVSHAGAQVKSLCDEAVWLENGSIRMMGPADVVVDAYEANEKSIGGQTNEQ